MRLISESTSRMHLLLRSSDREIAPVCPRSKVNDFTEREIRAKKGAGPETEEGTLSLPSDNSNKCQRLLFTGA